MPTSAPLLHPLRPRMRPPIILAGLLALVMAASSAIAVAGSPASGHEGHHLPPSGLMLNGEARWSTDTALRIGMNGIREAVVSTLHGVGERPMTAQEASVLADTIQNQVSYMIANCKLTPQADGVLHVLLGQLLEGAAALKQNPADATALHTIIGALKNYPVYFDHPDWKPVTAPEPLP